MIATSGSQVARALVLNVTRLAGLFGNSSVGYRISGGMGEVMDIKETLGGQAEGRLFFREGQTFSSITVPISSRVIMNMHVKLYVIPWCRFFLHTCSPAVLSAGVFVSG